MIQACSRYEYNGTPESPHSDSGALDPKGTSEFLGLRPRFGADGFENGFSDVRRSQDRLFLEDSESLKLR